MTTTAAHQSTYIVGIYDGAKFHEVTVMSAGHQGVKAQARRIAKDRGITVKYINDMFLVA